MQRPPRVEVLLDRRQQVRVVAEAIVRGGVGGRLGDEGVGEGLMRGHPLLGVNRQALLDELARGQGDAAPVFEGREGVVGDEDGLHFLEVGVAVKGRVAAEEEVGDHADCPDVAGGGHVRCGFGRALGRSGKGDTLHWFAVSCFLEDFRGHVAWRTACGGEDVECFLVHDS